MFYGRLSVIYTVVPHISFIHMKNFLSSKFLVSSHLCSLLHSRTRHDNAARSCRKNDFFRSHKLSDTKVKQAWFTPYQADIISEKKVCVLQLYKNKFQCYSFSIGNLPNVILFYPPNHLMEFHEIRYCLSWLNLSKEFYNFPYLCTITAISCDSKLLSYTNFPQKGLYYNQRDRVVCHGIVQYRYTKYTLYLIRSISVY